MKRGRPSGPRRRSRPPGPPREPLPVGQKLEDHWNDRTGTVLDFACQFAHPKAEPVFSYLVRWDDGQVQALSEHALDGGQGVDLGD